MTVSNVCRVLPSGCSESITSRSVVVVPVAMAFSNVQAARSAARARVAGRCIDATDTGADQAPDATR